MRLGLIFIRVVACDGTSVRVMAAALGHDRGRLACRGLPAVRLMRTMVIGAGVLGASAAYHLARAGAQVTVIDACLDGRATAAGAGSRNSTSWPATSSRLLRKRTSASSLARRLSRCGPCCGKELGLVGIGEPDQIGDFSAGAEASPPICNRTNSPTRLMASRASGRIAAKIWKT